MTNHSLLDKEQNLDITKHLESLKTRLGFARFKLRNGWENNTLLDVESLWKKRQQQMIDALPTPRFTQRDILDNRTLHPHYHYRPSINNLMTSPAGTKKRYRQHERRHSHQHNSQPQEQRKKAKLMRSLSTPESCLNLDHHQCATSTSPPPTRTTTDFYHPPSSHSDHLLEDDDYHDTIATERKRQITHTPPSPPADDKNSIHHHHHHHHHIITPPPPRRIRSSLDYLSYAIAMTEQEEKEQQYPAYQDTTDSEDSAENSAPPSPVTAAAEAMMMFGHQRT